MKAKVAVLLRRPRRTSVLPWLLLVLGIPVSFLFSGLIRNAIEDVARLRFEREARDAVAVMQERIQFYSDILFALRALFASQQPVSRLQFKRFVESLDLVSRFPGLDVVNYAVHVPAADKERFIESVRGDTSIDPKGYPHFDIRPTGQRSEYYVIAYIEPMAGFEFAFGRDLAANLDAADPAHLVVALQSARDSGLLTASGVPIRIKSRGREYTGLAMRLAVYKSHMPVTTVADRRAAYLGSIGAGFNIDDLMRGVLRGSSVSYMRLHVHDVRAAGEAPDEGTSDERRLLFDSGAILDYPSSDDEARFEHTVAIEVGGRVWQVHFTGLTRAIMGRLDSALPSLVLAAGVLVSVLLFGMFYSAASSRSRAEQMAMEMTEDLRQSTQQLQALSRRLVDLQESERRRFSRELHDQVGQNLTALSINLDILKSQLPIGNSAMHLRIVDAAALLESTAATIENVMAELRPPMLDDYGLLPALQWYVNDFMRRTGIEGNVKGMNADARFQQASEIALFRIVQEALNNVAKHAHASKVSIELARMESQVILTVTDDGVGYGAAAGSSVRRRVGLGMVTMRERTQAVGGQFEIGSAPGGGTRVVVRVPC
jgi:signal transduction histidine kinase